MPELIDKAKLIEYLAAIKPDEYVSAYGEAAVDVINHVETYVSAMPTIEPEVRHGRWIEDGEICGIDKYKCSLCGGEVGGLLDNTKYCCFCGAKMDGGADNAESD